MQRWRPGHGLELGDEAGEEVGVEDAARFPDVEFWAQGGELGGHNDAVLTQVLSLGHVLFDLVLVQPERRGHGLTTILDGGVGNVCKLGVRVNLQNLY